jgi:polyhydroxybutyrate depolymerase
MRRIILLLLPLLLPALAGAQALDEVSLPGGRGYLAAAPQGIAHPPLILALHGGGGSPAQFARDSGLTQAALAAGYAIVFPEGSARRSVGPRVWNAGYCCGHARAVGIDDMGFLDAVIADAVRRLGADSGRLFMTGMSNGGIMAETYAAGRPGRLRAIASVAGSMDVGRVAVQGGVAMMQIHGTRDENVPYAGGVGKKSFVQTDFASVDQVIAAFRRTAGRPLTSVRDVIDPARDGMRVERTRWVTTQGRVQIQLLTVVGGGHHWPGGRRSERRGATGDIDATTEVLAFFAGQG